MEIRMLMLVFRVKLFGWRSRGLEGFVATLSVKRRLICSGIFSVSSLGAISSVRKPDVAAVILE